MHAARSKRAGRVLAPDQPVHVAAREPLPLREEGPVGGARRLPGVDGARVAARRAVRRLARQREDVALAVRVVAVAADPQVRALVRPCPRAQRPPHVPQTVCAGVFRRVVEGLVVGERDVVRDPECAPRLQEERVQSRPRVAGVVPARVPHPLDERRPAGYVQRRAHRHAVPVAVGREEQEPSPGGQGQHVGLAGERGEVDGHDVVVPGVRQPGRPRRYEGGATEPRDDRPVPVRCQREAGAGRRRPAGDLLGGDAGSEGLGAEAVESGAYRGELEEVRAHPGTLGAAGPHNDSDATVFRSTVTSLPGGAPGRSVTTGGSRLRRCGGWLREVLSRPAGGRAGRG